MVNKRFDVMADRGGEDKTALCRLILGGINGRGIRWGVKKIRESGSKSSGRGSIPSLERKVRMCLPMLAVQEPSGVREKLMPQYSLRLGCHVRGKSG